jgi:hypothetical protein
MKRLFLLLALVGTVARAQEEPVPPTWISVSWLNFVATGGTDHTHALIQYLMFSEQTMKDNEELFGQLNILLGEIQQADINQTLPETVKQMEAQIAQLREMAKEHPELKAAVDEATREFERQKRESMAEYVKPLAAYSYDPAMMLEKLKALAINNKVYTGCWEAGNGLYSVTEVPRYYDLRENDRYSHTQISFAEEDRYKWGLIDGNGRQVTPYQYSRCNTHPIYGNSFPEDDVMFLYKQDVDGSVHAGALDYRGQDRIPFIYDDNCIDIYHHEELVPFKKDGKVYMVSIKTGIVDRTEDQP